MVHHHVATRTEQTTTIVRCGTHSHGASVQRNSHCLGHINRATIAASGCCTALGQNDFVQGNRCPDDHDLKFVSAIECKAAAGGVVDRHLMSDCREGGFQDD